MEVEIEGTVSVTTLIFQLWRLKFCFRMTWWIMLEFSGINVLIFASKTPTTTCSEFLVAFGRRQPHQTWPTPTTVPRCRKAKFRFRRTRAWGLHTEKKNERSLWMRMVTQHHPPCLSMSHSPNTKPNTAYNILKTFYQPPELSAELLSSCGKALPRRWPVERRERHTPGALSSENTKRHVKMNCDGSWELREVDFMSLNFFLIHFIWCMKISFKEIVDVSGKNLQMILSSRDSVIPPMIGSMGLLYKYTP